MSVNYKECIQYPLDILTINAFDCQKMLNLPTQLTFFSKPFIYMNNVPFSQINLNFESKQSRADLLRVVSITCPIKCNLFCFE